MTANGMDDGAGRPGAGLDAYAARLREVQERVLSEERSNLLEAARLLAGSLDRDEPDRMIHVFGCGHSHLMAEEAFWRAGGLVPVHPILDPNLTLLGGRRTSPLERLEGYARVLLAGEDLRPGEVMVVFSNSGINALPIEVALAAKEAGLHILAVTSLAHGKSVEPRHSSGRRLFELADVTVDTHVPTGDAAVDLSELSGGAEGHRVAPLSTAIGALVWNALVAEIAYLRVAAGAEPSCFISQNVPGGDEANEALVSRYRARNRFY
ncbi:MAG: SIS domain-containing protein, partial [Actinomycetota bacterium]|nr:SIS domain-containing protein [Actinomycetota bacterium]